MKRNRIIAGAATMVALAGGSAAYAATSDPKAAETAVLADAAKRLGVSSAELRSALAGAEDAQLAAAVKAGTLTQAQADEIKAHRQSDGTVLHLGPGGRGQGGHGGRFLLADAAKAIGISETSLMTQLRDGKTLSDVAEARGTTLTAVKAAVKQAASARLAADLKAGKLTQSRYDAQVSELAEHVDRLGEAPGPRGGGPRGAAPGQTATPTPTP